MSSRSQGVTIADVAKAAGVSVATVSRVMNGAPTVGPEMADRVRATAVELGYRPSAIAQGLARGRTGTIGVLVPDLANPYFHEVIRGLMAEASGAGYRPLVANSDEVADDEESLAHDLLRQTDGLMLCSPRMPREALMRVVDSGRPVVAVNREESGLALPSVTVDFHQAVLAICGHLARLGHERVAYLAGPPLSWSNGQRWHALSQTAAFGLTAALVACGSTTDDGYRAVDQALEHGPTALIAFNDIVGFGAVARLRERGIAVPDEVSIASFDDVWFAAYAAPALTTVRQPNEQLGRHGWRMFSRLLAGERGIASEVLVPELIVRDSTGPVPKATIPHRAHG